MLGLLLNSFRGVHTVIDVILKYVPMGAYHFGLNSTANYHLTTGRHLSGSQLAAETGSDTSLAFKNLTIDEGASVSQDLYQGDAPTLGSYSPLIIRCSDTLTLNGTIHADGCGVRHAYASNTNKQIIPTPVHNVFGKTNADTYINRSFSILGRVIDPIPINFDPLYTINTVTQTLTGVDNFFSVKGPQQSATLDIYQKIVNLGANVPFYNETYAFFGTGGATNGEFNKISYGLSSGGTNGVVAGGGSGGLVFLYYKHLYGYNEFGRRIEYGVHENFPVHQIMSCGVGGDCGSVVSAGGGCIIIAAENIILGPNARISANGTLTQGATHTSTNYSYFNCVPQLALNQSGVYWNPTTNKWAKGAAPDRIYYYNDGTVLDECNKQTTAFGTGELCGGAGIACGVRFNA